MSSPATGKGATRASATTSAPTTSATTSTTTTTSDDLRDAPTGQLIGDLSTQVTRLVKDEVRLAQIEVTGKAKRLGVGAGLFGGAGLVAFFGLGVLISAAVLGLATVLPGWLAALIVAVVLFAIAGILAMVGKKDVAKGSPPVPTQAIDSIKTDVATVKEHTAR